MSQSAPHTATSPGLGASEPPLIRALLRPEAYPHPADSLQLHETHASWVVLAGPYAYKIKKPVDFGFLDFSTLERRIADSEAEVCLNRRLCPDVYLGVVEVVERDGSFFVGGEGPLVEPAVWMRRLPADGMLPVLLERGQADTGLMRRIARRLARFHATTATGPGVDDYGSPAVVRGNWRENFDQMAPFVGRTVSPEINRAIVAYVERFLEEHADLLERRVATGRIRDGHGDLHAASICVEDSRLQLFDCLQFAARFRCADVAAEVAFLAMDLEHYGRADLAEAFVETYVRASRDEQLLTLLDFYVCYRAYVRGKVRSLRLAQPDLSSEETDQLVAEARAYFDLAWAHAGGLKRPALVVTMGPPASGKSTLARSLAGRLGLVHLSSDVVRKELAGLRPTEHRPEAYQQGLYAPRMTRRTYAALRRQAGHWLRRGRSVVLDATYGSATERRAIPRLAARTGATLIVLVCQADEATIRARLAAREVGPPGSSDARPELWPALRASYSEPVELPEAVAIDATAPPAEAIERGLQAIRAAISAS